MVLTAQETSLFPQDINNTISTLTSVINFLDMTLDQTGMANATEVSTYLISLEARKGSKELCATLLNHNVLQS